MNKWTTRTVGAKPWQHQKTRNENNGSEKQEAVDNIFEISASIPSVQRLAWPGHIWEGVADVQAGRKQKIILQELAGDLREPEFLDKIR